MPMGMPGWPLLAFSTASMASARIAFAISRRTGSRGVGRGGASALEVCGELMGEPMKRLRARPAPCRGRREASTAGSDPEVATVAAWWHTRAVMKLPLQIVLDEAPSREDRKTLKRAIDDFNARTVPGRDQRFAILLRDAEGALVGGLDGVIGW